MDILIKDSERKERANLDIAKWETRIVNAQTARTTWDSDAEICRKIRDNELPTRGKINNAEGFTDKFYVDNWIKKANYWKTSLLMGYDVYFDLKSNDGNPYDNNRDILETEINFAIDRFGIMGKTPSIIEDWLTFGYGVSYTQWNKRAIDNIWRTGKPEFRYFDPRNIWVDEGTEDPDWSDMRYLFALTLLDVEDAKLMFPKVADKITASIGEYKIRNMVNQDIDKMDVYLCQYKKKYIVEKVEIFNTATQETNVYLADELREIIESGVVLPETLEIGDTFEAEEDLWFQFFYSKSLNLLLSEPQYVGKECSFQFLLGYRIDKDVYPRSITWYLKDLQEISVILMTLLTIQAVKINKATPYVEENALEDEEDFIYNRDKLDFVGKIKSDWRQQNPGVDPIHWDRPEFRPDIPMALQNMIVNSIKTASGSVDSAMGTASYSGQSGVQTAQLQAAASIYTKQDEIKWHNYLRSISEKLKFDIVMYKTHEHNILGVDDEGNNEMLTVNAGNIPQFDADAYYSVPYVDTTPEIMKQMERDRAIQLNATGKMSSVDMLSELNVPNPELTYNRALEEQGWLQIVNAIKENPELMPVIEQDIQKFMSNTQNKA